ncbi:MAG: hypothetical protein R3342_01715 [Lutibacter sp.]|uniref:hypothetical protein n=1 Tax=Lutibacter sp. TaxID=1925666 RepID=UPI00299F1462|nr:hypothetical protein [Lutibacter sp.]MDX1828239.1 hypothetical protein [Lutibacter sp.]
MNFIQTQKEVSKKLNDNKEWVNRFNRYANFITLNTQNHINGRRKFNIQWPFHLYSKISDLKNKYTLHYDLRFKGQSVATLTVKNDTVTISTKDKEEKNKQWFNIELSLKNVLWKGITASEYRKAFKESTYKRGKSPEHALESSLLSEFRQQKKRLKSLYNIQPVLLANSFFQMPTPLTASKKEIKYARKGGGIDILARVKHEDYQVRLCVMELKDEYNPSEPPEKVMSQAIAYATFIAHLLRSKSGKNWYNIFGFSGDVPETLIIDTSIVMPYPKNGKVKHIKQEKIKIFDNTHIELYDLYFKDNTATEEGNNYKFIGSLKDVMLK